MPNALGSLNLNLPNLIYPPERNQHADQRNRHCGGDEKDPGLVSSH
ncbi:hypothetical protein [Pandoraea apista]|nr:hypothetical protein [Pandoraea apista]